MPEMHVFFNVVMAMSYGVRVMEAESSTLPDFDCPLPVIKVGPKDLQQTDFEDAYRAKFRPVILHNATGTWGAHERWKNNGFLHQHGELRLMARPELVKGGSDHGESTSLKDYLHDDALRKFILLDFGNESLHRTLLPDCSPTPLPLMRIRDKVSFTLGRNATGSGAHQHNENWISQIVGRKAWILAPPDSAKGLPEAASPCNLLEASKSGSQLPKDAFVCVIGEGETIYLPDQWWHATCNLDAITVGIGGKGSSSEWPAHLFYMQDGDMESLEKAAVKGVDILAGTYEAPAVHFAARSGDMKILEYLLQRRGDPMQPTSRGENAAHFAVQAGHVPALQLLLARSKKLVKQRNDQDEQPIHTAVQFGCSDCVAFLLSQRVSVTSSVGGGNQLVHWAAGAGSISILQTLLEHRARMEARDGGGGSPLHWAARFGRVDAARWLLESAGVAINSKGKECPGCQPIHDAAFENQPDMLDFLVEQRADLHARDNDGRQPLHLGASNAAVDAIRRLMDLRADVRAKDNDGDSPLRAAKQSGHKEVLRLFKKVLQKTRKHTDDL